MSGAGPIVLDKCVAVPVTKLRAGEVVAFRTAAHGRFTVKWQREGIVMTTDGWCLDLRHHHERDIRALNGKPGHVLVVTDA